jgi:hypothetical protein
VVSSSSSKRLVSSNHSNSISSKRLSSSLKPLLHPLVVMTGMTISRFRIVLKTKIQMWYTIKARRPCCLARFFLINVFL